MVDIRRQNMLELLFYKALFETTDNRRLLVEVVFQEATAESGSEDERVRIVRRL